MSRKKIRPAFKLPWKRVNFPNSIQDGKYDYWRLEVSSLIFDMATEVESQKVFYLMGVSGNNCGYNSNLKTIEEAERFVINSIREIISKLKVDLVIYEKFIGE